jgi:general secretion pathway protein G
VSEKVRKYLRGEKGFTLVEMMVVLVIIAVLIAGGITYYLGYISRSKITKADGDIATIQASLESYYAQYQTYPTDATTLTTAGCSSSMVGTPAVAGVPYVYTPGTITPAGTTIASTASYVVATSVTVDSNSNYVVGTGANGTSNPVQLIKPVPTPTT